MYAIEKKLIVLYWEVFHFALHFQQKKTWKLNLENFLLIQFQFLTLNVNEWTSTWGPKSLENLFIQKYFSTLWIYHGIPANIK